MVCLTHKIPDRLDLVLRLSGKSPERTILEPQDSVRAELEAFADAVEGRAAYPIPLDQMLATVSAFEATVRSVDTGETTAI